MIGHITILSILGSTLLVNAAPSIQGFARGMREPNCTNMTAYNPKNLDAQKLNGYYFELNLKAPTCDFQSIDSCTQACLGLEVVSCGMNSTWVAGPSCGQGQSCFAYPNSTEAGTNVTQVGCLSVEEAFTLFEKHGYHGGPIVLDNSTLADNVTDPGMSTTTLHNSGSSTVPGSMSTPNPLSSTTKVLSSVSTSMSSSASIPTLTGSVGSIGKRNNPSSVSPTLSTPTNNTKPSSLSSNSHSFPTLSPSSVNPCPTDSGLGFTLTSSELGGPTGVSEMDPSGFSDSSSTCFQTSMSSGACNSQPTPLPSSSTSMGSVRPSHSLP